MPEREIGEERGRGTAARQGFLGEARRGFPGSRFRDALRAAASSAGDGRGRGGIRRVSALECGFEAARRGPRVAVRTRGI